jgi:hypothetical protein
LDDGQLGNVGWWRWRQLYGQTAWRLITQFGKFLAHIRRYPRNGFSRDAVAADLLQHHHCALM